MRNSLEAIDDFGAPIRRLVIHAPKDFQKKCWMGFLLVSFSFLFVSCSSGSSQSSSPTDPKKGAASDTSTYKIEIQTPTPEILITRSTARVNDPVCTGQFEITVKKNSAVAAKENVTLSVESSVSTQDLGKVEPATGVTDAQGKIKAKYCGGDTELVAKVLVKVGSASSSSPEISVIKKPTFTFTFKGVEEQALESSAFNLINENQTDEQESLVAQNNFSAEATPTPGSGTPTTASETPAGNVPNPSSAAILLNLYGSGKDRINLLFEATISGTPYAGASASFRSQIDFPVGAKLAECGSPVVVSSENPGTGKNYLKFDGVSNSAGIFRVPVCASRMPGNLLVSGTLTTSTELEAKTLRAQANMIRIEGGLANYGNISVTFDNTNAKVMKTSFVSNAGFVMNFIARLQSILDGVLSSDNPLGVLAEYGKVIVSGDGKPAANGIVNFTVEPLNSGAQRPHRVTSPAISNGGAYDVMCTPTQFTAVPPITFSELSSDWRSTVMYYLKGQEQYFDSNVNGVYDIANSVGFWDRNQNGVFDCNTDGVCDQITFVDPNKTDSALADVAVGKRPFGAPNCAADAPCLTQDEEFAIYKYDWFIDLSSPFVDGDENGDQRVKVGSTFIPQLNEYVVGDTFLVPNGKWDREGHVWKSFVLPIYVGTSPYAINQRTISANLNETFLWQDTNSNGTYDNTEEIDTDPSKDGLARYFMNQGYSRALHDIAYTTSGTQSTASCSNGAGGGGCGGAHRTLFGCRTSGYYGLNACRDASIAVDANTLSGTDFFRYFFAQGTCGSPLPGGTPMKVQFESRGVVSDVLTFGGRTVSAHFYMQPGDWLMEPGRRLLADARGTNTAKLNTDPTQHPSSRFGYPVQFKIGVSACTAACTGDVATEGVYCPAVNGRTLLTVDTDTIPDGLSVGSVKTCTCAVGATFSEGACKCPTGTKVNAGVCVQNAQ